MASESPPPPPSSSPMARPSRPALPISFSRAAGGRPACSDLDHRAHVPVHEGPDTGPELLVLAVKLPGRRAVMTGLLAISRQLSTNEHSLVP